MILQLFTLFVIFIANLNQSSGFLCLRPQSKYGKTLMTKNQATKCGGSKPEPGNSNGAAALMSLCPSLMKQENTDSWKKGENVLDTCRKNATLQANTAVATFHSGHFGQNDHAAVFLSCEGVDAIKIADQYCGKVFGERVVHSGAHPYDEAKSFYVIVK